MSNSFLNNSFYIYYFRPPHITDLCVFTHSILRGRTLSGKSSSNIGPYLLCRYLFVCRPWVFHIRDWGSPPLSSRLVSTLYEIRQNLRPPSPTLSTLHCGFKFFFFFSDPGISQWLFTIQSFPLSVKLQNIPSETVGQTSDLNFLVQTFLYRGFSGPLVTTFTVDRKNGPDVGVRRSKDAFLVRRNRNPFWERRPRCDVTDVGTKSFFIRPLGSIRLILA